MGSRGRMAHRSQPIRPIRPQPHPCDGSRARGRASAERAPHMRSRIHLDKRAETSDSDERLGRARICTHSHSRARGAGCSDATQSHPVHDSGHGMTHDSDKGMIHDSDHGMAYDSDHGMAYDSDHGMARDSCNGMHLVAAASQPLFAIT
jgi:hypothetical protein